MLAALDSPDQATRERTLSGIYAGDFDTPETRARLWQALDDPDDEIRAFTSFILVEFKEPNIVSRLDALLREPTSRHPAYFEAAQQSRDLSLLPALEFAKERLSNEPQSDGSVNDYINSAIYWLKRWNEEPSVDSE